MFFSAKALHSYLQEQGNEWSFERNTGLDFSLRSVRKYVKAAKEAIVRRDGYLTEFRGEQCLYKWYRPWEVVPK